MSKTNVVINYHDFHPSEQTKEFIESVVHQIHSELPQGATVRASFSSSDKLVKGMLRVGSFSGPFFSVAASEDLHEVTLKLVEQMRRRIERFKSKQHSRDGLKQAIKRKVYAAGDGSGETGVA